MERFVSVTSSFAPVFRCQSTSMSSDDLEKKVVFFLSLHADTVLTQWKINKDQQESAPVFDTADGLVLASVGHLRRC